MTGPFISIGLTLAVAAIYSTVAGQDYWQVVRDLLLIDAAFTANLLHYRSKQQ